MSNVTVDRDAPPLTASETQRIPALGLRSALALLAVVVGVVPFLLLWKVVVDQWAPLARLDGSVADFLNAAVRDSSGLVVVLRTVTDLGGTATAAIVMTGGTVLLAMRRRWRPALFLGVTGVGLLVLIPLTKALVDRARPVVDVAVVTPPENASFPSGHAMASLVIWVAILIVALPHLPRRSHPWLFCGVAVVVVGVGFTRLALGVHFVSDVLAGWVLGAAWVAATATVFWTWQRRSGREAAPSDPLGTEAAEGADVAAGRGECGDAPVSRSEVGWLAAVAAALSVALYGLGVVVTGAGPGTIWHRFDEWLLELLAYPRSDTALTVAELVGALGGITAMIALALALAVLAATFPRPGRAMLFVATTLLGVVLVYFMVSRLVSRIRPELGDLAAGLPQDASWPSGHAAAAVAVYGASAVLVTLSGTRPVRWAAVLVPLVIPLLVAWSRVYTGEHYPTDVLAGLLLGGVWLLACTRLVLSPARQRQEPDIVATTTPTRKG